MAQAGYVQVKISGQDLADQNCIHSRFDGYSDTADVVVDYVRSNEGNMFYWGRRGPSVHLRYGVPRNTPLQYAYSEVTVPEGQDVIGSYFMANGFGEGYFGMQVNSATERRVCFRSGVHSLPITLATLPKDQQVLGLARGPEVKLGEFGNEGSGGQSYLIYPWKAGMTYRFLTEVKPDGKGSTRYTSWFGPKDGDFRLIASFSRPKTDTTLKGFHSFLENFAPETGNQTRQGFYGNVWVRDTSGAWHECTEATFSVDPTGGGRHRLDYTGGAEEDRFFMKNCGFFAETGRPGDVFKRTANGKSLRSTSRRWQGSHRISKRFLNHDSLAVRLARGSESVNLTLCRVLDSSGNLGADAGSRILSHVMNVLPIYRATRHFVFGLRCGVQVRWRSPLRYPSLWYIKRCDGRCRKALTRC